MNGPDPKLIQTEAPDPAAPGLEANSPLPQEAFPCPSCGQMLGASVRVCVSCGQPVDLSKIGKTAAIEDQPSIKFTPAAPTEPARFSWAIFAIVLAAWLLVALAGQRLLDPVHEQFLLAGIVCVTSVWVFYDARARNVPHPFRWSMACILFWIVFFPWYLARRRTPTAPCAVMDESAKRLLWWLIPIFVFFLLVSLIVALLHGTKK